jgi:hypothetical protein
MRTVYAETGRLRQRDRIETPNQRPSTLAAVNGHQRWVGAVVGVALLIASCESGAALGTACVRAAECASPLVCRLGRCRVECGAARDCGAGQVCLVNGAGEGACEIPAIDACSLSCDAPLVCVSGHCRVECAVDGDCPDGHACVTGACQRIDSTPDAGASDGGSEDAAFVRPDSGLPCDPIADTGCTGARCGLERGVPGCVASTGTAVLGGACGVEADCNVGLSCQGGRCVRICAVGDDPACGGDSVCSRDSVAGQDALPAGNGLGLCSEACNPTPDEGCPPSATCAIGTGTSGNDFTWCRTIGGGAEGDTCDLALNCAAGLDCRNGACRAFCDVTTGTCDAGRHCDGETTFEAHPQVGACVP